MGPNTDNEEIMRSLVKNGMNIARFKLFLMEIMRNRKTV